MTVTRAEVELSVGRGDGAEDGPLDAELPRDLVSRRIDGPHFAGGGEALQGLFDLGVGFCRSMAWTSSAVWM